LLGAECKLEHLLCLTLVAHFRIPLDIFDDVWPPKMKQYAHAHNVDAFVIKVIVCFLENAKAFVWLHYYLVSTMGFSVPEVSLKNEEARRVMDKHCEFVI
jgi:hypothetical protein